MKRYHNINLTFFAIVTIVWFIFDLIIQNLGLYVRGIGYVGPYYLNEIMWESMSLHAILVGIIFTLFLSKVEKMRHFSSTNIKGRELLQINSLGLSILFYTILFFIVILIFVVREYIIRNLDLSFVIFCYRFIPLGEVLETSFIFGTILSIGFYKPSRTES